MVKIVVNDRFWQGDGRSMTRLPAATLPYSCPRTTAALPETCPIILLQKISLLMVVATIFFAQDSFP